MKQPVSTVNEFCAAHRISRTRLYQEWKDGTGPRFFRVGAKILITDEAGADWRREREAATAKQVEAA